MTYEQINENFLPVGIPTRYNDETSSTEGGKRRKIGRKGIGKLGSLQYQRKFIFIQKETV